MQDKLFVWCRRARDVVVFPQVLVKSSWKRAVGRGKVSIKVNNDSRNWLWLRRHVCELLGRVVLQVALYPARCRAACQQLLKGKDPAVVRGENTRPVFRRG